MGKSVWPSWQQRWSEIDKGLQELSASMAMPGITSSAARETLSNQIVSSLRRMAMTENIKGRDIDPQRAHPSSPLFDPERAALRFFKNGDVDEAVWLTFLSTHFGKHKRHGWRRLQDFYGGLGGHHWTWARVSSDVPAFRSWLSANSASIGGAFGNHRKYESLSGASQRGTGSVVQSYIDWIGDPPSHQSHFAKLVLAGGNDPHSIFDVFYNDMQVARFGRLGKFDFLAHLGRLGFAPIEPGSAYLKGATGPLRGARLLFGGKVDAKITAVLLQGKLDQVDKKLGVGMQVLEDSICNWQKSPSKFVHFTG